MAFKSLINEGVTPVKVDLHVHTCFSDGEHTLEEIKQKAASLGIPLFAVCDHDTVAAVLDDTSPHVIKGVELSAKDLEIDSLGQMHIVGLNVDPHNPALYGKTQELRQRNIAVTLALFEILRKDFDLEFSDTEIETLISAKRNLGRPEIAKLCVEHGYATSVKEAFGLYLTEANNKLGPRKKGLPYEEVIDVIIKSGGVPVLAHPKTLGLSEFELLKQLRKMQACGLQAMEVFHSKHTPEEAKAYLELANKLGLAISAGSDYHGKTVKPDVHLGIAGGGKVITSDELSVLKLIRRR